MLGRRSTGRTGQIGKKQTRIGQPKRVFGKSRQDEFGRWERAFEARLELPDPKTAWLTILQQDCDPRVVKSALYYAAKHSFLAREAPEALAEYIAGKKRILSHLSELKNELRALTSLKCGTEYLTNELWEFFGFRRQHVRFFKRFPAKIDRLERVLAVPKVRPQRLYAKRTPKYIDSHEAPLHIYLEETTGKLLMPQTAVLLEAAADAYGLEYPPGYDVGTVAKRYKRFREDPKSGYELYRMLNQTICVFKASRDSPFVSGAQNH